MSEAMKEQKQKERKFLEQLLNNTKLDSYEIPVPIKAELRKYQQVRTLIVKIQSSSWRSSAQIQRFSFLF